MRDDAYHISNYRGKASASPDGLALKGRGQMRHREDERGRSGAGRFLEPTRLEADGLSRQPKTLIVSEEKKPLLFLLDIRQGAGEMDGVERADHGGIGLRGLTEDGGVEGDQAGRLQDLAEKLHLLGDLG